MSGKQSADVTRALRMVARGSTAYAAAKKTGIALSTIYRALKRKNEKEAAKMITWIDLGYGDENQVLTRLPAGTWTVIRDDDAATVGAPCWIVTQAPLDVAQARHEHDGGTVSACFQHIAPAK